MIFQPDSTRNLSCRCATVMGGVKGEAPAWILPGCRVTTNRALARATVERMAVCMEWKK